MIKFRRKIFANPAVAPLAVKPSVNSMGMGLTGNGNKVGGNNNQQNKPNNVPGQSPMNKAQTTQEVTQRDIQLAQFKQQNQVLQQQRLTQKIQAQQARDRMKKSIATQKAEQAIRDNQVRVKRMEMQSSGMLDNNIETFKPQYTPPPIVSIR